METADLTDYVQCLVCKEHVLVKYIIRCKGQEEGLHWNDGPMPICSDCGTRGEAFFAVDDKDDKGDPIGVRLVPFGGPHTRCDACCFCTFNRNKRRVTDAELLDFLLGRMYQTAEEMRATLADKECKRSLIRHEELFNERIDDDDEEDEDDENEQEDDDEKEDESEQMDESKSSEGTQSGESSPALGKRSADAAPDDAPPPKAATPDEFWSEPTLERY